MDSSILLQATIEVKDPNRNGTAIFNTVLDTQDSGKYYNYALGYAGSDIYIDYGDGKIGTIQKGEKVKIHHTYAKDGTYTITVKGAPLVYKTDTGATHANVACTVLSSYKREYKNINIMGALGQVSPTHIYQLYLGPGLFGQYDDTSNDIFYLNCGTNSIQNLFYPRTNLPKCVILEDDYNATIGSVDAVRYVVPATFTGVLPVYFEKQLPYLGGDSDYPNRIGGGYAIAASTDFESERQLRFDSTGQSNLIGPKLNGQVLGNKQDTITHTYSTFPNKTIKKILGIGHFKSDIASYSLTEYISFDTSTHTLTVPSNKIGGAGEGDEDDVFGWIGLKFIFEDNSFDCDYFYVDGLYITCLLEGTPIRTIDGIKDIQRIQYDDLILTYDFFRGKLCYQFPSFIDQDTHPNVFAELILDDDSVLRMSGAHDFYNMRTGTHAQLSIKNFKEGTFDKSEWRFMQLQKDNSLKEVGIKDIKIIEASTNAHSLYTAGTQSYFANNILCSNRDFSLFGKTINNRLNLDRLNYVKNNFKYTKDEFEKEFGKISSTVYYGQNQHILYNGAKMGLDAGYEDLIESNYVSYEISAGYGVSALWSKPKPLPSIEDTEACYIALMEDTSVISKTLYKVGTIITLPYAEKGWYCVADANTYYDKYEIKTNTVLEKVV